MSEERLRRSLEELFSDISPPAPEGEAEPGPPREIPAPKAEPLPPPSPPVAAPPPAPKVEPLPTVSVPPTAPPKAAVPSPQPTRLTIRNRLIWGFAAVLLLILIGALASAWALARLDQTVAVLQEEGERATAALQIARATADLLAVLGQASSTQDADALVQTTEDARRALARARRVLNERIANLPGTDPVRLEASRLQARTARVDSLADLILPRAQAGDWGSVRFYQTEILAGYHHIVTQSADGIVALTEERRMAAVADAATARQLFTLIPGSLGVLILAIAVTTAITLVRSITERMKRLTEGAALLAAGHLEERVPIERNDELGLLALTFNEMADRLQALYAELEERVNERTRALQEANYALQRRAIQLEASAEVGRAITSMFEVDALLRKTVELIRDRFGFYHAGIFLLDSAGEWAVLHEATGEAGARMKVQGHRLPVGETSMVGWTALHRQARVALDVGEDAVHFANPLLPYTRSEITLPLMVGGRLLGVLDVQSTEEAAFEEDDVRVLQGMADQIAVAIENARRISEEAALLEATSPIFRASRMLTTAATLEEVGQAIVTSIAETGAEGCFLALFEPLGDQLEAVRFVTTWRRDGQVPIPPSTRHPISVAPMRMEMMQQLWSVSDVEEPSHLSEEELAFFRRAGVRAVVHIPLRIGKQPLGFISAYRFSPGAFPAAALRLYEALTDMASVAVERVRLTEALRQQAQQEATLRTVGDRIAQAISIEDVLRHAADTLGQALRAGGVFIELAPEPTGAISRQTGGGRDA